MKPKVIGRASTKVPPAEAMKFISSTGIWDELSQEDRDAFVLRSEILDTVGGNKLAQLIARRSGEQFIKDKYFGGKEK